MMNGTLAEGLSRDRRSVARSRRLRVAMASGIAALALLALAAPAHGLVLLFQGFSNAFAPGRANGIASFKIGESGGLTQTGFLATGGDAVEGVAVRHQFTPNNDSQATVFVANCTSNTVSVFTVRSDGTLSPVGSPVATGGSCPLSLAVSPDGRFLYAANHFDNTIAGFRISANGGLSLIGLSNVGASFWGLSVSPHGVLYAVQENAGTIAAMRIESTGQLTHLTGSPYTVGTGSDQLTASDVSVDGRFLFVTAGSGSNQGVWSFALSTDGRLASTVPITRVSSPVPIGVETAPGNRHVYIVNRDDSTSTQGNGGVTGYSIGSNGSLTRILGASSAGAGTPFFTGGQQAHALELIDRLPTFLYVAHEFGGASIGAFNVDFNTGLLSPIGTAGAGGVGDAHFSNASTTTGASSIVNRDRSLLRFLKTPGSGGYSLTISNSGSTRIFLTPKPRRIVPVPGSGCVPGEAGDIRSLGCTTTNVSEVRVFTSDGNNTVNAQNGVAESVICGTSGPGFDNVKIDALADPPPFNCEQASRAPVGVGRPAKAVGRSARVKGRVATLRLRCPSSRQGNRCKGRAVIVRCPKNRPRGRCRDRLIIKPVKRGMGHTRYSIKAGQGEKVPVKLENAIRGRKKVRVLTIEHDRDDRPMIGSKVMRLKRR